MLGVSVVLEYGSLLGCLREIKKLRGERSLAYWVRNTRNAELVVVLGEDLAALLGLVLAFIFVALAAVTGNTVFDAIGSIVIGVVLVCVSMFIAMRIKGLIVGRSAEEDLQEALAAQIAAEPGIDRAVPRHHHPDGSAGDAGGESADDARPVDRRGRGVPQQARAQHQGEVSRSRLVLRRTRRRRLMGTFLISL